MRKLVSRLTAIIAALAAGWIAYRLARDDSRDTLRAPPRQSLAKQDDGVVFDSGEKIVLTSNFIGDA